MPTLSYLILPTSIYNPKCTTKSNKLADGSGTWSYNWWARL